MNDIVSHVVYDRSHTHFPDRKQLSCTDVCHESWKLCNISHEAVGYQRSRTMLFRSQRFYNTYTNHVYFVLMDNFEPIWFSVIDLSPVVRGVDNAKRKVNLFLVDGAVHFVVTYPLDSDSSVGYRYHLLNNYALIQITICFLPDFLLSLQ